MKKYYVLTVFLILSFLVSGQNNSGKIIILHTNDLHSNITGFSPEIEYTPCTVNDDHTVAGFARIAGIIKEERGKNPENTLVLDAGDFLMGTFFPALEEKKGFQLNIMKKMGYDVVSFGNHEFDYGPEVISNIINSARKNGDIPRLTLANVKFNDKSEDDNSFEELYKEKIISPYQICEINGLKIGIFGILGENANKVAPNIKPLEITDRIKSAEKMVKILKNDEKADFVICLSHSGVIRDKKGNWSGEDIKLAQKVKGIDVIISGHTHVELAEPIWINDIPIVQTGSQGKNIGRFEINIHKGKISSAKYQLLKIDDAISGDCDIHKKIEEQINKIDDELLKPMGLEYYKPLAETNYDLEFNRYSHFNESNLGPMLADAIHYYVNEHSPVKTDLSVIATGVIRDKIRVGNDGIQTVPDIFRVVSLGEGENGIPGYPLAQVYLTGKEIKKIMELLIIISNKYPVFYCFFSGIEVYYDGNKGSMKKIKRIRIGGEDIDFSKKNKTLYGITANSHMLEFVGAIKKVSHGLVNIKPKDINGNFITDYKNTWIDFDAEKEGIQEGKEWIAVVKFISTFEDINGNEIPDFPEKYSKPLNYMIDINSY
ncbi:MAG: bifunctional metallophosphatase/5'-nucleotidase [Bacteroidales bacterium]|jgi:5'-nucleotidase|nr:bifunctional metallophosphatase/5'-nucleotidase [Bacteroidales bacterium]